MSALTLTLVREPDGGVDLSPLSAERLAGKSAERIARMRLACGGRRVAVGTLFEVTGEDPGTLRIRRARPSLHGIGRGAARGTIEVSGSVGEELGRDMSGGLIRVRGDASHHAGACMSGGHIDISGSAGDHLGAGWPGHPMGMRGGTIRVGGDAGARVGEGMRRGLIVVEGGCGQGCGSRMVAGSIVVLGASAAGLGAGMRRGTIVLFGDGHARPATFNDSGKVEIGYVRLLLRHGAEVSRKLRARAEGDIALRRWVGDMGALGKGEVLVLA